MASAYTKRKSFDLSRATMWHRDKTPHDNALFGLHRFRQDDKTKVRQRTVWAFVVLSLGTTRCKKVFQISHHRM
jgi:hypothetical protein